MDSFGESVPKQEREPKDGVAREDVQHQDGQGRRTRLTQIRDDIGAIVSKIVDEELVQIALNGFSKPWDTFVKGVVARKKLPDCIPCGMTLCRRRPTWVKDQAHPTVPHRLWMRRL